MVLCDQKSAYPRVQWPFLQKVMARMRIHPEFCAMVAALYRDPALHVKVNGHIGEPFAPMHGLHQGCGLSPLIYLCALQTFTSLAARDKQLQGVVIPGEGGRGEREVRLRRENSPAVLFLVRFQLGGYRKKQKSKRRLRLRASPSMLYTTHGRVL